MSDIMTHFLNPVFYWLAWIIIPLFVEVVPAIVSFFVLLFQRNKNQKFPEPAKWPIIEVVIPVYNSEDCLEACLDSIYESNYPNDRIEIFLVNNMSSDRSFQAFDRAQKKYPNLRMNWLNAEQGKSRALNLAIYNSEGEYLINIDSDGYLEKNALKNMVLYLENHREYTSLTGSILTRYDKIEKYGTLKARLFRRLEFTEYAQAFLAGRNYASATNNMYTLSGAFSAFRMSSIRKSHLYNTETISEDTEITFQLKYIQKEKVGICVDAIYYTDPIESVDKLYTQRQRWQRGSLEVARLYPQSKLNPWRFMKDTNIYTLLFDHTFALPRMIWYLALIVLMIYGYSGSTVLISMGVIFLFYIICGYLYFYVAQYLLKPFPETRKYYLRQWPVVALLPFYNFVVFFIRIAGIINSINTRSSWKTDTLTRENDKFRVAFRTKIGKLSGAIKRFRRLVNYEDKYNE